MALNFEHPGNVVEIAKSGVSSGDPVKANDLTGVSLCDTDDSGNIRLATEGVYEVSVKGSDGGNTAVNVGDKVYYDGTNMNVNNSNTLFGIALGSVGSGATADIPVLLLQG